MAAIKEMLVYRMSEKSLHGPCYRVIFESVATVEEAHEALAKLKAQATEGDTNNV